MFWIRKVPAFVPNADSQTGHYDQMIREVKSKQDRFLIRYYKSDWWSIIERKLMPGAASIEEMKTQVTEPATVALPDDDEDVMLEKATRQAEEEYEANKRARLYNAEDEELHQVALDAEEEKKERDRRRNEIMARMMGGRLRRVQWTEEGPGLFKKLKDNLDV